MDGEYAEAVNYLISGPLHIEPLAVLLVAYAVFCDSKYPSTSLVVL